MARVRYLKQPFKTIMNALKFFIKLYFFQKGLESSYCLFCFGVTKSSKINVFTFLAKTLTWKAIFHNLSFHGLTKGRQNEVKYLRRKIKIFKSFEF